ncbi:MAG: tryptophan--tRNA ligase [Candidatus Asgardarchaeia archaeon]
MVAEGEPHVLQKSTDYQKLIKEFGVTHLSKIIHLFKEPHYLIRRGIFFAHRDLDKILEMHREGKKFAIVSGRGPSHKIHLGHIFIFQFIKWFQDEYNAEVFIPLSDDEKYVYRKIASLEFAKYFAYDNALDIAALGFKPEKTHFFISTEYTPVYKYAVLSARHLTFNTIKAVFGFTQEINIGAIFYPATQASHILLPTLMYDLPVLVPIGIDQDPYIRVSRDVADKLNIFKPAAIHSKFIPGLDGNPMSASKPETSIFLNEDENIVKKKIWNALTGGRGTLKEQRELGGEPDKCVVFDWFRMFFVKNDSELAKIRDECKSGARLCGQCKKELVQYVKDFLKMHKERRKETLPKLQSFFEHPIDENVVSKIEAETYE